MNNREELNSRLKGKEMNHTDGFVYVGGMVTDNRHLEIGVRCRIQPGVSAWRKVTGVMIAGNYQKC